MATPHPREASSPEALASSSPLETPSSEALELTPAPPTTETAPAHSPGDLLGTPQPDGWPAGPDRVPIETIPGEGEPEPEARPATGGLLELVGTGFKASLVALLLYGLLFNFSVVRGSSMAPGIQDGDRILVDHLSYMFRDVQHGDIVVLRYPLNPTVDYIKRVVGLPGDAVLIRHGHVWVNGEPLEETYVREPDMYGEVFTHVRPGHFFVLGDNRRNSSDSREFGQVPATHLRGKVDLRVWPFSRLGILN